MAPPMNDTPQGSGASGGDPVLAHESDVSEEVFATFARAHPGPDHETALRLRRWGNLLIAASVILCSVAAIDWVAVPFRSALDRAITVILPLFGLLGLILVRINREVLTWAEEYPDRYAVSDDRLQDFFAVDRFDVGLGWLSIPGITLLIRFAYVYQPLNPHLQALLEVSLWAGMPLTLVLAVLTGHWAGRRRRRSWLFRSASLLWAFFFVLGAVWGVNVVFAPGAGTVYQVMVARDYRPSPYDGNYATMDPPIYLRPFAVAPRGLRVMNPAVGRHQAGDRLEVTIGRGVLGLQWIRGVASPR